MPRLQLVKQIVLTAAIVLWIPLAAQGFDHDEVVDGDLSGDRLAPTRLIVWPGSNELAMTSGSASGSVDRDYFTIYVPEGWMLDQIFLLTSNVDGAVSFIGLQGGTVLTEPPTTANVANLLGWHHFAGSDVQSDILDDIATGPGAAGFIPPLGSGFYTFWAQDFGFQADYSMRFRIAPVPEPGLGSLLGVGILGIGIHARSRRSGAIERFRAPK